MTEQKWIQVWMPVRLQFTVGTVLVAECIVQGTDEAERVRCAYMNRIACGAVESRETIRQWNVKVGENINANTEAN